MRALVRYAVFLYPAVWRARYAAEMEALLEDAGSNAGDVWDIVRGALSMQMTTVGFWKILTGCALAGVLAAGIWSATMPDRYISTAVMRIRPVSPAGDRIEQMLAVQHHMTKVQQNALSRKSLTSIIVAQNLYANERKTQPLEDIIETMRQHDIRLQVVDAKGGTTFVVNFRGDNPAAAQSGARALVSALVEEHVMVQRDGQTGGAENLEVLDPASLPSESSDPDRLRMVRNGLLAGLGLGLVCGALWTIVRRRAQWSAVRIAGFAAAGMAIGVTIAILIPNEFISTAVLRTVDAGKLQPTIAQVLSDESLAAIVRQHHLFRKEVARSGMDAVVKKMRNQNIRVQTVGLGTASNLSVFTVSFRYPDRFTAQRVNGELVMRFLGQPQNATEIVDPPSDPLRPSSPNRMQIAALGTILGTILGLVASRFRRPKLATA